MDEVVLEFFDETVGEIRDIFAGISDERSETKESAGYNYWKGVY